MCMPVADEGGAVGDQATPAEPVGTCEHHRVVQNPKTDDALVVLQHFCRLLILTHLLHKRQMLLSKLLKSLALNAYCINLSQKVQYDQTQFFETV